MFATLRDAAGRIAVDSFEATEPPIHDVTTANGVVTKTVFAWYGNRWWPTMRRLVGAEDYAAVWGRSASAAVYLDRDAYALRAERVAMLMPSGRVVVRHPSPTAGGEVVTLYTSIEQYRADGWPGRPDGSPDRHAA